MRAGRSGRLVCSFGQASWQAWRRRAAACPCWASVPERPSPKQGGSSPAAGPYEDIPVRRWSWEEVRTLPDGPRRIERELFRQGEYDRRWRLVHDLLGDRLENERRVGPILALGEDQKQRQRQDETEQRGEHKQPGEPGQRLPQAMHVAVRIAVLAVGEERVGFGPDHHLHQQDQRPEDRQGDQEREDLVHRRRGGGRPSSLSPSSARAGTATPASAR